MTRAILAGAIFGLVAIAAYAARRTPDAPATVAVAETAKPRATVALASPRHDPALEADLASKDAGVRRAALREAVEAQSIDAFALVRASRDADLEIAVTAAGAASARYVAGQLPATEIVALGRDRTLHEKVRASALAGLTQVQSEDAARTLADLLASGDLLERRIASGALARQAPELAVPALIGALGDADEHVRAQALGSLRTFSRGRDFGYDAAAWREYFRSAR